jgi:hypothetical protein
MQNMKDRGFEVSYKLHSMALIRRKNFPISHVSWMVIHGTTLVIQSQTIAN